VERGEHAEFELDVVTFRRDERDKAVLVVL
jgi:hypothetical protein